MKYPWCFSTLWHTQPGKWFCNYNSFYLVKRRNISNLVKPFVRSDTYIFSFTECLGLTYLPSSTQKRLPIVIQNVSNRLNTIARYINFRIIRERILYLVYFEQLGRNNSVPSIDPSGIPHIISSGLMMIVYLAIFFSIWYISKIWTN